MSLHLIFVSCFILVTVILSLLQRATQASIIHGVDVKLVTPSDFTIMAYNIPKNKTSQDLRKWLEDHHW
jgi:hypothetical protein